LKPLKIKEGRPEDKIRDRVKAYLQSQGWFVKVTHGNAYQDGFPDLFACHRKYGQRWIEIKLPNMRGSKFTAAQLEDFPQFVANGSGVWILTDDTEFEYNKLFKPPNWYQYLGVMKN
jgi:hypothetical protein